MSQMAGPANCALSCVSSQSLVYLKALVIGGCEGAECNAYVTFLTANVGLQARGWRHAWQASEEGGRERRQARCPAV